MNDDYKDSTVLTHWTRGCLYALIAISGIALSSHWLEYQLLVAARDGFYPGDAALEASDARQAGVGVLYFAVYLTTMVFVLVWIHRANHNVRELGGSGLRFSPAGAIGWYFVPILHLWRPYRAMKEIWQASLAPHDWHGRPIPVILPIWWTLWLVSHVLGNLDWRLVGSLNEDSSVDDFILANIAGQASAAWQIPLSFVLLAIVKGISRMQAAERRRALSDAPQVTTFRVSRVS